jgi:hypothetical protein
LFGSINCGDLMHDYSPSSDTGYSPDISAELLIHGRRFNLASLGPDRIIVRTSEKVEPGRGTIRLRVDQRFTLFHIDLPQGIDPAKTHQPYLLRETIEQAAA